MQRVFSNLLVMLICSSEMGGSCNCCTKIPTIKTTHSMYSAILGKSHNVALNIESFQLCHRLSFRWRSAQRGLEHSVDHCFSEVGLGATRESRDSAQPLSGCGA